MRPPCLVPLATLGLLALLPACGGDPEDADTSTGDVVDTGCDDATDEDLPTWYADADGDGYGDPGAPQAACDAPANTVADATDCDDANGAVHPGAVDACDALDNDCDGGTDEDAPSWYADADADGFGDPNDAQPACAAPEGTIADGSDCDDTRAWLHPYDLDGDGAVDGCGYREVAAGGYWSCALDSDGLAVCWGRNATNYPPPSGVLHGLVGGDGHAVAIDALGAFQWWGNGARNAPAGEFVAVSAAETYACGVDTAGAIQCGGSDVNGALTPPSGSFTAITSAKTGYSHSCALAVGGAVQCWGWDNAGQTAAPAGTFTAVGAGGANSCGLDTAGSIVCWGDDFYGQSSAPAGTFVTLDVGLQHGCAIDASGAIECWGYDGGGLVTGVPSGTFVAVSSGTEHVCAIDTAGAVQCWGNDLFGQTDVP